MDNLNSPAMPLVAGDDQGFDPGFTKRERACIDLRIPESGDSELDVLIEAAQRREVAAKAMQGFLGNSWQAETLDSLGECSSQQIVTVAEISCAMADALLDELERTHADP